MKTHAQLRRMVLNHLASARKALDRAEQIATADKPDLYRLARLSYKVTISIDDVSDHLSAARWRANGG